MEKNDLLGTENGSQQVPNWMLNVNLIANLNSEVLSQLTKGPSGESSLQDFQKTSEIVDFFQQYQNLLNICGFCPCDADISGMISPLNQLAMDLCNLPAAKENGQNLERSHYESTQKVTSKSSDALSDPGHRDGDESLLDVHPHEIKYFTNERTGRQVKQIICKIDNCGRKFDKKWNFKDHIRMHLGEKPYECKVCQKKFIQKGNLQKHMKKHLPGGLESRKIHQCGFCFRKFTEKYNMKHHQKTCKHATS